MEEEVAFLAGNLEANEAEPFSGHDGLLTFTAVHDRRKSQGLPPPALLVLPCRTIRFGAFPDPCRLCANAHEPGRIARNTAKS